VHVLFGGPVRTKIKVCIPIFRNLNEKHVEQNLALVDRLLGEGFDNFRVYIGGSPDFREAFFLRFVTKLGTALTMQAFDLSSHVHPTDAVRLINRLRKLTNLTTSSSIAPPHDVQGMAEARAKLDIPVSEHVGDSRHAIALWKARAVDIINVANSAHGGMRESLKVFAVPKRWVCEHFEHDAGNFPGNRSRKPTLARLVIIFTIQPSPSAPSSTSKTRRAIRFRYCSGYMLVSRRPRPGY
jgi:muconate cycloisomerase